MRKLLIATAITALSATSVMAMDGPDHEIFMIKKDYMAKSADMIDVNSDGMVSKEEYIAYVSSKAAMKAAEQFDKLDSDKKGMMMKDDFMVGFEAPYDK